MKLLPFREYRVEIPLTMVRFERELSDELSKSYGDRKGFLKSQATVFRGTIDNGSFKFRRQGFGNTTMIPFIKGEISEAKDSRHSVLSMKVIYHPLVYLFIGIWFSFVATVLHLSLIHTLVNRELNLGIPGSLILLFFGSALVTLSFSEEVKTIKRFFNTRWNMNLD